MRLERARELLEVQVYIGQGYNLNSAKLILAEVQREHGIDATNRLIAELDMETIFGFKPGQIFKAP
ncbi:MAG: hypothetical protein ACYST9_04205 [Planctomycetota bacterium]|jgi:hypothetical protein